MQDIPLSGGNTNASVVRVGDTVRRAPARPTVHRYLRHLEQQGMTGVPRYLGQDDQGRDMMTFLPGSTAFPSDIWAHDRALIAAAQLLRRLHDASIGCDHSGDWAFTDPGKAEVICHNDFAPYNMTFTDGVPTGIFDFDLCGPGPRLRDLAYLAYWMVPLSFGGGDMTDASLADKDHRRLKLICASYGSDDTAGLLDMVSSVLHHMSDHTICAAMVGEKAARNLADGGHFAHWAKEAKAFDQRLPAILACLG